ncbi:MAG: alpha-E domain-containing protein [Magnetococcus sp. DMHC-1]|nr:alpha-E domain-containing protein [Magnetococcales bacterium]
MLSRVAENIYWMARYLERVEGSARLVIATNQTMLDIAPISHVRPLNWFQLIAITGSRECYAQHHAAIDEANVVRFLIADTANPSSILSSLRLARENMRSTREVFPREAWESLNGFTMRTQELLHKEVPAAERHEFLEGIINACLKLTGLLDSTMCRDEAFHTFRLGRYLERADMTTRILDVRGAGMLESWERMELPLRNAVWLTVLRSLSGDQMYRRRVEPRIRGPEVLAFLLKDRLFPRTFRYCIEGVGGSLKKLHRDSGAQQVIKAIEEDLYLADVKGLAEGGKLHEFLDKLQIHLGHLHEKIGTIYFNPPPSRREVAHAHDQSQFLVQT